MYDHVLLPVAPGHFEALDRALGIARLLAGAGGRITALTVIEDVPSYVAVEVTESVLETSAKRIVEEFEAHLAGAEGVAHAVVHGHPARAILDHAEDNGVDCIVLQSHRPNISDYFLGSTAARVVRHAPVSVHVLR